MGALINIVRIRPLYGGLLVATAMAVIVLYIAVTMRASEVHDGIAIEASFPTGPPWHYGPADARFTVIAYADLECPHCEAQFPVLRQWIDENADVNWQWHHLPLAQHEPAATEEARLAECAGETAGHAAFWRTVAWIYEHTRGGGRGLPAGASPPGMTHALQECLASDRPDALIRTQADEAARDGIAATPTLRLIDHQTGRSLWLPAGAVGNDALLSAVDWLAAPHGDSIVADPAQGVSNVSADTVSGTPR